MPGGAAISLPQRYEKPTRTELIALQFCPSGQVVNR
jgi:hypothetical protein